MRSIFLTGIAALAFAGGPALAADFTLKAPVYAPAYSWQGCYAGFNGGGVWNSTSYNIGNNNPAYFGPAFASGAMPSYYSENVSSGILGGQAGCNLQSGSFVYGVEGDAEWVNHTASDAINTNVLAFGPGFGVVTQKLESIATIRARVGYAFDHLLLYGTGGIALGNTNDYYRFAFPNANQLFANTYSTTRNGWTLGAGAEYAFCYHWSVQLEGLWYHLDGNAFQAGEVNSPTNTPPGAVNVITSNPDTGWTLKVGLNYKVW
jgi:outer membrane immunogenic protein